MKGGKDLNRMLEQLSARLGSNRCLGKRGAATYLGISVSFLERLMRDKGVPHFRVGCKLLFRRSELDSWLEGYRVNSEIQDIKQIADEAVRKVLGKDK